MWRDGPLVALDLETTGTDPWEARIVSVALLTWAPGTKAQVTSRLVNPGVPIPEGASKVHGLTDQLVRDASPIAEVMPGLLATVARELDTGAYLVAYNAPYDLTVLCREAERSGLSGAADVVSRARVVDPLVLDKATDPYRKGSRRLADVCRHHGVALDDAHESGADALAAARLAYRLGKHSRLCDLTIEELHQRQIAWHAEQAASLARYFQGRGDEERARTVGREWPAWSVPFGLASDAQPSLL